METSVTGYRHSYSAGGSPAGATYLYDDATSQHTDDDLDRIPFPAHNCLLHRPSKIQNYLSNWTNIWGAGHPHALCG
jgi:hypothetical protein